MYKQVTLVSFLLKGIKNSCDFIVVVKVKQSNTGIDSSEAE